MNSSCSYFNYMYIRTTSVEIDDVNKEYALFVRCFSH